MRDYSKHRILFLRSLGRLRKGRSRERLWLARHLVQVVAFLGNRFFTAEITFKGRPPAKWSGVHKAHKMWHDKCAAIWEALEAAYLSSVQADSFDDALEYFLDEYEHAHYRLFEVLDMHAHLDRDIFGLASDTLSAQLSLLRETAEYAIMAAKKESEEYKRAVMQDPQAYIPPPPKMKIEAIWG